MKENWGIAKEQWISTTSIADETALWAIDSLLPINQINKHGDNK